METRPGQAHAKRHFLAAIAVAIALTACGGGAVFIGDNGGFAFTVNAFQDGFDLGHPVHAGEAVTVTIQGGQSIEFDANGAVTWRFSVNGGAFVPAGTTASVPGLSITVTPVGSSRVRVTTVLTTGGSTPVTVTLTATSNLDQREVATVQLQVR
ncbi:MAG: hypothetical protein ACJ8GO_12860 [Ramlibacter sp.]